MFSQEPKGVLLKDPVYEKCLDWTVNVKLFLLMLF